MSSVVYIIKRSEKIIIKDCVKVTILTQIDALKNKIKQTPRITITSHKIHKTSSSDEVIYFT